MTSRLSAGGNTQLEGSLGESHVPTVDETATKLVVVIFHADERSTIPIYKLQILSFDVLTASLDSHLGKEHYACSCKNKYLPHSLEG